MAEVLKGAGYATGIIGKWGLGEPGTTGIPNRQGFDEWFGYLNQHHAHNYYPDFLWKDEHKYRLEGNEEKDNIAIKRGPVRARPVHPRGTRLPRPAQGGALLPLPHLHPAARQQRARACAEGNGMEVPSDAAVLGRALAPGREEPRRDDHPPRRRRRTRAPPAEGPRARGRYHRLLLAATTARTRKAAPTPRSSAARGRSAATSGRCTTAASGCR